MPTPRRYQTDAQRQSAYRERQSAARRAEQQAKGLPPLPTIPTMPGEKRWQGMADHARVLLQAMRDEMQSYFDDRSETWQEGDKGEAMQGRIDALDGVIDQLDNIGQNGG